jgi:hypothetical protein
MSTHMSVLVDSVGPPSVEVCRAATSFPSVDHPRFIKLREEEVKAIPLKQPCNYNTLVRCICALVRRRDSEIQVVVMIISSKCNLE